MMFPSSKDGLVCRCLMVFLQMFCPMFVASPVLGRIGTYNHVHCNNLTVILMHLDHLDHPPHPALRTPRDNVATCQPFSG